MRRDKTRSISVNLRQNKHLVPKPGRCCFQLRQILLKTRVCRKMPLQPGLYPTTRDDLLPLDKTHVCRKVPLQPRRGVICVAARRSKK